MPEGDRPRPRPADGRPRAAADGHRRLERRARRDRQPGPGRERLARLLPLLHPRPDGRHRRTEGGPRRGRTYYLGRLRRPQGGPGADLAGRPLPAGHPRRRHRDRREGERRLGDRRPDGRLGRDVGHQPRARPDRVRDGPAASSRRRRRSSWAGRRSARTPSPTSAGAAGIPKGVRENGMYCHGVQWLVGAARILAEQVRARGPARRGPPLPRDGLPALAQDLADPPRRAGRDRDLRRPAEQAGGRHGDDVRPRPDDLERLHRGGGLDVPPGPRRACSGLRLAGGRMVAPADLAPAGELRPDPGLPRPDRAARCRAPRSATAGCSRSRPNRQTADVRHGPARREDEADGDHLERTTLPRPADVMPRAARLASLALAIAGSRRASERRPARRADADGAPVPDGPARAPARAARCWTTRCATSPRRTG